MLAKYRRTSLTLVAIGLLAGRLATASAAAERGPSGIVIGPSSSKNLGGMRIGTRRPRSATAPVYTIHDVGAPPGYDFSSPSGFNNTGQIYGQAGHFLPHGGSVQDCVVWSAGVFRRVPVAKITTYGTGCVANGMNDAAAASGEYEVVGSATEEFAVDGHAFAAVAGPGGFKRTTTYFAYAPSTMVGVNAAQISAAAAEYDRDTAYDVYGLLYATATGASGSLGALQASPSATTPVVHVLAPTYRNPCPFGGCAINDRNEVLGYDFRTAYGGLATVALFTVGQPASLVHVPLQDVVVNNIDNPTQVQAATAYPVAFNDLDQLLYLDATLLAPAIYDVATGVRTVVPVAAPGCVNPVPLSMNNEGEMLGTFASCPTPIYYTWDAAHGTQYLNAQLPANAYTIVPLGVNDNGQILVKLTSSAAVTTWGTLDPVATRANGPLRARTVKKQ